tara:strand:+ start:2450 stop:2599 length:150 start_codon:yes stop_codon:yes gene_type:complete
MAGRNRRKRNSPGNLINRVISNANTAKLISVFIINKILVDKKFFPTRWV